MTKTISTEEQTVDHKDRDILTVTFDDGTKEEFIGIKRVQHEDIGKAKTPGFIALISDQDRGFEIFWITDETLSIDSIGRYTIARSGTVPRITVLKPMMAAMPVGMG